MSADAANVAEEGETESEIEPGWCFHACLEERPVEAEIAATSGPALDKKTCWQHFGVAGNAEGVQVPVWMDPQPSSPEEQQQP